MTSRSRPRITYPSVAATLALFLALTGPAWAVNGPAPGINSVGTSDIINQEVKGSDIKSLAVGSGKIALNAVTSAKVLDNSLTGADVLDNSLTGADLFANTLTGAQIAESTLSFSGGPCPSGQFVRNVSGGTLTCGPTGDNTAFGLSALDSNTSGRFNSALGSDALTTNTTGINNSAVGWQALHSSTTGSHNVAVGSEALWVNQAADRNTAVGDSALEITRASDNTAVGHGALQTNTVGIQNTAVGQSALFAHREGSRNTAVGIAALGSLGSEFVCPSCNDNIALGEGAGFNLGVGSNNIYIGNDGDATESNTIRIGNPQHTSAYLGGVRGNTVDPTGAPVYVDPFGELGTIPSSRRFKRDIGVLGASSDRLMKLRPVSFRYRQEPGPLQYGLIAEQVAKVYPELVSYGRDGKPYTVRYDELPALLLAQNQEQQRQIRALQAEVAALRDGR